ncbi:MAG: Nramp family divalent metal transporter [Flavobacteriaceae bacterium]|nr:Nramp family divalent metal transporter [Flavobacteriaceae bacterium]
MINIFRKLGPGLLFAGAAIGVSHLVQSTRAGADFGFGLIWALILINLVKYPFFQFGPRYALATGESLLEGYKRMGRGVLITYYVLNLGTMFTIQAAVTAVTAGIAAQLLGIDSSAWVSVTVAIVCFLVLLRGTYRWLDKSMKIIVILLSISTLLAVGFAFGQKPTISLLQVFPVTTVEWAFLIAFMGWMPGPMDISVWHSLWALEKKKITPSTSIKSSLFDFNIGYLVTLILGVCFVVLGTIVMHDSGISFSSNGATFAGQLIGLYTSLMGSKWFFVIAVAALATMFSTTLTTLDASPRVMAHTTDLLKGKYANKQKSWLLILTAGTCVIFIFFASEMGLLVKIATILSFLTAPLYAAANLKLVTGKYMPARYRPSKLMCIASVLGILFLVGFGITYLYILL